MRTGTWILSLLFLFIIQIGLAQTNFRVAMEAPNPIPKGSGEPMEEKLKVHEAFLAKAEKEKDILKQIYGHLYLATDYISQQEYAQTAEYLLRAEALAVASDEAGWLGWVFFRKGELSVRLKEYEEAARRYEKGAALCHEAGDSLCVGECFEQLGVMHGLLDDFQKAKDYHHRAMGLLEKYGSEAQMATAFNNFGIINSLQKRYAESVRYYERAIEFYQKLDKPKDALKTTNNLANSYRNLKKYDLALEKFQECERLNKAQNFSENLIQNYVGMGLIYESMGNYKDALRNFEKHEILKDSLIGAKTQQKIAELEIKYETQQKELELEKSNAKLLATKRKMEQRTAAMLFGLLLLGGGLWVWRLKAKHAKRELFRSRESLNSLAKLLVQKNQKIGELAAELENKNQSENKFPPDSAHSLYDQTILTDDDWTLFKSNFEMGFPGYLLRLRDSFPSLSEAEERLFLLIKLNFNSKEIAAMIGISPDSVKRTRNRLRKRLNLEVETNLEDFVRDF